jgi:hypothetical protein
LQTLIVIPVSSVFTDQFQVNSYSSTAFAAGSFSFSATVARTDANGTWGQALQLQVTIFYK